MKLSFGKLSFWKLSFWNAAIVAAVLAPCGALWAQNSTNPIQVALLRWYQGNTVAHFSGNPASTCSAPTGLAFDGTHIWVACKGDGHLQELNASDGKWMATVSLSDTPVNLLYDGANIWVTNGSTSSGRVYKVDVAAVNAGCSSGPTCVTGPISVGSGPWGLAFDGTSVWVSNYNDNTLYKVSQSGSSTKITSFSNCTGPFGLAFDTQYIWVACSVTGTLQQLTTLGTLVNAVSLGSGDGPFNLAYDGAGTTCATHTANSPGNLWVTGTPNSVWKVSACTYSVSSPIAVAGPDSVAFDTKYIWVSNNSNGTVTKLLASSPSTTIPGSPFTAGTHPTRVAFDGGNIWVANQGSNDVSKF